MTTKLETAKNLGERCGKSANDQDWNKVKFEREYFAKWLNIQIKEVRKPLQQAFDHAYTEKRNIKLS